MKLTGAAYRRALSRAPQAVRATVEPSALSPREGARGGFLVRIACAFLCALAAVSAPMEAMAMASSAAAGSASPAPAGATPAPIATPTYYGLAPEAFDGVIKEGDEGDEVFLLQERLAALGYFNYRSTGYFGASTKAAVAALQAANGRAVDGDVGGDTYILLYGTDISRGYGPRGKPTPTPTPVPPARRQTGREIQWSRAHGKVARRGGPRMRVRDYRTQVQFYFVRVGGYNHMDVEPASAGDTRTLKSIYGGRWSWDRRPVVVRFNGDSTWYAGSMNGMPHGYESISGNGMTGQVCLHFTGSRTHGSGLVDPAHQRCIKEATGRR